jgi:protein ImuA
MRPILEKLEGARQLLHPILGEDKAGRRAPLGHADADAVLRGGLITGTLHEIRAADAAATGFLLGIADRASAARKLIWIAQDFASLEHGGLAPTGLAEIGLSPDRLILMRAADATDALRAGTDALSCAVLGAVIIEIVGNPKVLDLTASRRLMLGAQQKGVTAFLLRTQMEPEPSAAETRWHVGSSLSQAIEDWGSPRFEAALTRNRHGETGRWIMEWDSDNRIFCDAADPGALAAAPSDGQASAPQRLRVAG